MGYRFCPSCGQMVPLEITAIEYTPTGYVVKGKGICPSCASFFEEAKRIDVELKALECPMCHKNNFDVDFKTIRKVEEGYEFSALLQCRTRGCNWKKGLKSSIQTAKGILEKISKVKLSATGIEIERHK